MGHRCRKGFRLHLESTTAVVLGSTLFAVPALGGDLPSGGTVAAGQVSIGSTGSAMQILQGSQNAIVNWNSFSIGADHSVEFVQPNASAAILNRVTGSTTSTIAGSLKANGQVYLINPNGIAITASGAVDVGSGFVASSLDTGDEDFLSGKRRFTGKGASAEVTNAGTIRIGRGGYAALIGGAVANDGLIAVETGKIGLGSGEEATLDLSGDGFLQVAVPTTRAGKDALIENHGTISASGGQVVISAATARNAARHAVNLSGTVEANTVGGTQGRIVIGGGAGGKVTISGKVKASASHGKGGKVTVTGQSIALNKAHVDAIGTDGGGTVLIGGARQGRGATQTAGTTTVDADSTIAADATINGHGGEVVIWSDLATDYTGTISAKGAGAGAGGDAEVSGKAKLNYDGSVDLSADSGQFGTLLLDPYNITIANAPAQNSNGLTATGNNSVISTSTLQDALSKANVILTTGGVGSAGGQEGDITVADALTWSSSSNLLLSAYRNIAVNANLTGGYRSSIGFRADNSGTGTGTVSFANGVKATARGGVEVFYSPAGNSASSVNATSYLNPLDYSAYAGANTPLTSYMLVNTIYDLQNIQNNLNANYALGRNIDANSTENWGDGGGTGFMPIGSESQPFEGQLNGFGYTINGLNIDTTGIGIDAGLFGTLGIRSVVQDLGITNAKVNSPGNAGILAAYAQGNILRTYTSGAVGGYRFVGGLVGMFDSVDQTIARDQHTTISRSFSSADVFGYSSAQAGGLVGALAYGYIDHSFASGAVTGDTAGGLAGSYYGGLIEATFATGPVNGTRTSGGLIALGSCIGGCRVNSSTWDIQSTGQTSSFGSATGTGSANAAALKAQRIFLGYKDWSLSDASPYPEILGVAGLIGVEQSTIYGEDPYNSYDDGGLKYYEVYPNGGLTKHSAAGSYASIDASGFTGVGPNGQPLRFFGSVGSVSQRPITITAEDTSRDYGSTNPLFSYDIGGSGLATGDSLSGALATSATETSNTGSYNITQGSLTDDNNPNYRIQFVGGTLTIAPKPITVTATDRSRVYGNANPGLSYTADGLLSSDILSGTLATSATATSDVGSYAISQGTLHNSNYDITFVGGVLHVTPRTVVVAADSKTRIYGNTNPDFSYNATGLMFGDTLSGQLATSATATSDVGSYAIGRGTLSASPNYTISYIGGVLTITARPVTISATNAFRAYGDVNPDFSYTVGGMGLVSGDVANGTLSTAASSSSSVGTYTIGRGNLSLSPNYDVTFVPGQLSVTPRQISVRGDDLVRPYNTANPPLSYQVMSGNLINGDALLGGLATGAGLTSPAGVYSIDIGNLRAPSNYQLNYTPGRLIISGAAPASIVAPSPIVVPSPATIIQSFIQMHQELFELQLAGPVAYSDSPFNKPGSQTKQASDPNSSSGDDTTTLEKELQGL